MKLIGGYNQNAHDQPLHEYQRVAVDFLLDRLTVKDELGAGLFMDPGLGKTRVTWTAIDLMFKMDLITRALVIAPLRPLYTVWPVERREWGFAQTTSMLHKQCDRMLPKNRQVELMNFGSLKRIAEHKNRWDIIVIDESTFVKNWSTKRMRYIKSMIKTIPKRIILTGTPAANSLADLFAQLYIVDDGESLGRTITTFRANFCQPGGWQGRKWHVKGGSCKLLKNAIGDRVLRMQAEDYLDMPKLVQNNLFVELPDKTMRQYKRFEKELVAELEAAEAEHKRQTAAYEDYLLKLEDAKEDAELHGAVTFVPKPASSVMIYAPNAASAYMKCRQLAAGPIYTIDEDGRRQPTKSNVSGFEYAIAHNEKIKALEELAEMLGFQATHKTEAFIGKPLLIAYNFTHELAEILKSPIFKRAGVINGKTKPGDLERNVKHWNNGTLQFLVCQWKAASHGLNLQKGDCADIVAFSLTDSPETYEQLYRRIYRQGVTANQVRVHRILSRNTVDEVQLQRLEGKFSTQKEFLDALKASAKRHLSG